MRTKRIFISDIHMGDQRSLTEHFPYGWFNKNIGLLAKFLEEQLNAPDVKEVVILGDLFDQWVIPVNETPLTSFADICSNPSNQPVIEALKALAKSPDIKLAYVPGNHDMSVNIPGIKAARDFMGDTFPGIRFFCDKTTPWGVYSVGNLAAEHGNHYCLFNAPDSLDHPDDFLPLGYFISRLVAFKASTKGQQQDSCHILFNMVKDLMDSPTLVDDVLKSIARDAGLDNASTIALKGIPGYPDEVSVGDVGDIFKELASNWERSPANLNLLAAIVGDQGDLHYAADSTYFHRLSHINVVIFGHTHKPVMRKGYHSEVYTGYGWDPQTTPCKTIYANSGTWVDHAIKGCTYVETEQVPDKNRLYVRVKGYPGNAPLDADHEGFIET